MPCHAGQPPGQALDVLGPGLPGLTRRHLPEEVEHRIEARRRRQLAAATTIPERVEIYVVIVGAVNVIVRGMTVLSLMSKSNDTLASGTVACGAFMRNRVAYSTLSRCAVAYLDMLGSRGNSVVAI